MLETVLNLSESDQYPSTPKEISKFPLMYMTGYFCRSVYIHTNSIYSSYGMLVCIDMCHLKNITTSELT